jgi:hypothetical protein
MLRGLRIRATPTFSTLLDSEDGQRRRCDRVIAPMRVSALQSASRMVAYA